MQTDFTRGSYPKFLSLEVIKVWLSADRRIDIYFLTP